MTTWASRVGTAASAVQVSLRYPATGTATFAWNAIMPESNPPNATIPASVWKDLENTGKGTDVATVRSDGIEFPFPGYLNNIVRQIALNFKPRTGAKLKAEVRFLIHRDGSVSNLVFVRKSGVFSFDLEAQGAVEAASSTRRFGPLPAGFPDDVLPVVFSFDPEFLR